jgi:hypothetical protein
MKKVYVETEAQAWREIHDGKAIITGYRPNMEGIITPSEWVELREGKFVCTTVCWSSFDHGFGTCRCFSHDSEREDIVTWEQAAGLIKAVINYGPPWAE